MLFFNFRSKVSVCSKKEFKKLRGDKVISFKKLINANRSRSVPVVLAGNRRSKVGRNGKKLLYIILGTKDLKKKKNVKRKKYQVLKKKNKFLKQILNFFLRKKIKIALTRVVYLKKRIQRLGRFRRGVVTSVWYVLKFVNFIKNLSFRIENRDFLCGVTQEIKSTNLKIIWLKVSKSWVSVFFLMTAAVLTGFCVREILEMLGTLVHTNKADSVSMLANEKLLLEKQKLLQKEVAVYTSRAFSRYCSDDFKLLDTRTARMQAREQMLLSQQRKPLWEYKIMTKIMTEVTPRRDYVFKTSELTRRAVRFAAYSYPHTINTFINQNFGECVEASGLVGPWTLEKVIDLQEMHLKAQARQLETADQILDQILGMEKEVKYLEQLSNEDLVKALKERQNREVYTTDDYFKALKLATETMPRQRIEVFRMLASLDRYNLLVDFVENPDMIKFKNIFGKMVDRDFYLDFYKDKCQK